eukprot:284816571_2
MAKFTPEPGLRPHTSWAHFSRLSQGTIWLGSHRPPARPRAACSPASEPPGSVQPQQPLRLSAAGQPPEAPHMPRESLHSCHAGAEQRDACHGLPGVQKTPHRSFCRCSASKPSEQPIRCASLHFLEAAQEIHSGHWPSQRQHLATHRSYFRSATLELRHMPNIASYRRFGHSTTLPARNLFDAASAELLLDRHTPQALPNRTGEPSATARAKPHASGSWLSNPYKTCLLAVARCMCPRWQRPTSTAALQTRKQVSPRPRPCGRAHSQDWLQPNLEGVDHFPKQMRPPAYRYRKPASTSSREGSAGYICVVRYQCHGFSVHSPDHLSNMDGAAFDLQNLAAVPRSPLRPSHLLGSLLPRSVDALQSALANRLLTTDSAPQKARLSPQPGFCLSGILASIPAFQRLQACVLHQLANTSQGQRLNAGFMRQREVVNSLPIPCSQPESYMLDARSRLRLENRDARRFVRSSLPTRQSGKTWLISHCMKPFRFSHSRRTSFAAVPFDSYSQTPHPDRAAREIILLNRNTSATGTAGYFSCSQFMACSISAVRAVHLFSTNTAGHSAARKMSTIPPAAIKSNTLGMTGTIARFAYRATRPAPASAGAVSTTAQSVPCSASTRCLSRSIELHATTGWRGSRSPAQLEKLRCGSTSKPIFRPSSRDSRLTASVVFPLPPFLMTAIVCIHDSMTSMHAFHSSHASVGVPVRIGTLEPLFGVHALIAAVRAEAVLPRVGDKVLQPANVGDEAAQDLLRRQAPALAQLEELRRHLDFNGLCLVLDVVAVLARQEVRPARNAFLGAVKLPAPERRVALGLVAGVVLLRPASQPLIGIGPEAEVALRDGQNTALALLPELVGCGKGLLLPVRRHDGGLLPLAIDALDRRVIEPLFCLAHLLPPPWGHCCVASTRSTANVLPSSSIRTMTLGRTTISRVPRTRPARSCGLCAASSAFVSNSSSSSMAAAGLS